MNIFWRKKRLKGQYVANQTKKNLEKMFFLMYVKEGINWYVYEMVIPIFGNIHPKVSLHSFSAREQI